MVCFRFFKHVHIYIYICTYTREIIFFITLKNKVCHLWWLDVHIQSRVDPQCKIPCLLKYHIYIYIYKHLFWKYERASSLEFRNPAHNNKLTESVPVRPLPPKQCTAMTFSTLPFSHVVASWYMYVQNHDYSQPRALHVRRPQGSRGNMWAQDSTCNMWAQWEHVKTSACHNQIYEA